MFTISPTVKNALISFVEGLVLAGLPSMGVYAMAHIGTVLTVLGIGGASGVLKVLYNYFVTNSIKVVPTPTQQ